MLPFAPCHSQRGRISGIPCKMPQVWACWRWPVAVDLTTAHAFGKLNYKHEVFTLQDGKYRRSCANPGIFCEIWNWFALCEASTDPCHKASGEAMGPLQVLLHPWDSQLAEQLRAQLTSEPADHHSLRQYTERSKGLWLLL